MNTTENNKLIAEFMGYEKTYDRVDEHTTAYFIDGMIKHNEDRPQEMIDADIFHPDDFEYHTSWDWLMPVVEKIEVLGYTLEKNYQRIDKDWQCLIVKGNDILFQEFNEDSRLSTHYVVVEFIKWYNENK